MEDTTQSDAPQAQSESDRMAEIEARLAALEGRPAAEPPPDRSEQSGDFTHSGIQLVGRHLPEKHSEVVSAHERQTVELPGTYEIGAVIEGAFIPIARLKAAEVLEAIERVKSSASESDAAKE